MPVAPADMAVFVGPSLPRRRVAAMLPGARIEPPAGRGDLLRLLEEGTRSFLIVDGAFAHQLAVSPAEVVIALRAGARVVGAASLGAIRAAECAPAGMEGVGAIARLYRLRVISDDDEVAVAVEPERDFRATSVALINVRFAVLAALRRRLLRRDSAAVILAAAKRTHFSQRQWPPIFDAAGVRASEALAALCRETDIKRRDAEAAVAHLAALGLLRSTAIAPRLGAARPVRYRGHDPRLGMPGAELGRRLVRWLMASGRYRRYLPGVPPGEAAERLWAEVERQRELQAELLRWHAVARGAALVPSADGEALAPWLPRARHDVAREHGFGEWRSIEARGPAGLPDYVPLAWIREAAWALALARRNLGVGLTCVDGCGFN